MENNNTNDIDIKVMKSDDFWKRIVYRNVETEYYVSRRGDVYNSRLKSMVSQFKCSSGNYLAVHIFINGIDYKCMVHRLVATAFIPNPENKPQVNHKDTNTFHNVDTNLEWATPKENIQWSIKMGNQVVGINHKNCKYTEDQIHYVCELLQNTDLTFSEVCKRTGVGMKTVKRIKEGTGWKHIACDYMIDSSKRNQGPRFSPLSQHIYVLVVNGKSNKEIVDEITKLGLNDGVNNKSISDRIYHIRKISGIL